jgi:hypothetical protein
MLSLATFAWVARELLTITLNQFAVMLIRPD